MAVEIPVVIDIEGSVREQARRIKSTMKPLQDAIEQNPIHTKITIDNLETTDNELKKLNDYYRKLEAADWSKVGKKLDISPFVNQAIMELKKLEKELNEVRELRQMEGGRGDFSFAEEERRITEQARSTAAAIEALQKAESSLNASYKQDGFRAYTQSLTASNKELEKMREYYSQLEDRTQQYSSSINYLRNKMSELSSQWNNMTQADRKGAIGAQTFEQYKKASLELRKQAHDLQKMLEIEERRAKHIREAAHQRRYEDSILKTNVKTIRVLQEQQRLLTERLERTKIGTEEFRRLQIQLEKVNTELKKATGNTNAMTGAMKSHTVVMKNLTSIASMYFSVFGLLRFAKQLRDITGELEYQRVALGNLIRDEEYGAKLFERIKAAAVESPFRITQLVTYTKQLAAYRIEQENLFDVSKRLADVSAGLGVDMNRLILAYGQVRAASVLRGQELRQFTEAGIPIVELLAEKFTELNGKMTSTADVFRLISERAVPFSMISDIFEDLTEKGGMFYQMQEKQAKTLKGRWEKLKDAFDIAIQTAGETKTFEWQNKLLLNLLTFLAKNIRIVPKLIEAMGAAWVTYSIAAALANRRNKEVAASSVNVMTTEQFKAAKIKQMSISMLGAAKATKMYTRANAALAASNGFLSRSFAKLQLFMLTNPIGAIATAVAGLASLFVFWRKKTDETTTALDNMDAAIEKINNSTKAYERGGKLIEQYEKLASKTERTTEENNKLHGVMSRLSDLYPELTEQIYDENRSLEDNVNLLKGRREALLAASKEEAAGELVSARQELAKRDQDVDNARKKQIEAQKEAASWGEYEYNKLLKSQQKQADKARVKAEAAAAAVVEAEKEREKVAKRIATLERYIDPAAVQPFETAWQNTLARMKDVEVEGTKINLFSDEDIRGYESIYKALQKIDKEYINSNESLKEMKASLSEVSDEYRDQALEEIKIEEARRNGYKAILDVFGYKSSSEKKNKASDLTILKEELKTVQDIYKKYKEFAEYMGSTAAAKKIKEIYGSVTAIDFLNPEDYKKRIKSILQELRKLQGRLQSSAAELSTEAFSDLKETIKKNEGFVEIAKKLPGEPRPTVGYGFYGTLPDGRKVSEGMRMTREEAEKLLDLGIEKRLKYVNNMIAKYGNGLVFNEKQMNVLLDLAWQSGNGVGRVLEAAEGDASKIVELLKTAATDSLITKDPDIIAGVKKRDMRRSKAFELAMSEASEDADAIAQAIGDTEKLVQDVDWEEMKKAIDTALKRLAEEIKRSENARNFFQNIFDITGDQDLAATMSVSVYGDVGENLQDKLREQLKSAFVLDDEKIKADNLDVDELKARLEKAISTENTIELRKLMKYVVEENKSAAESVVETWEKADADILQGFAKALEKYASAETRSNLIKQKTQTEIQKVVDAYSTMANADGVTSEQRANLMKMRDELIEALRGNEELELKKLSDDYVAFFSEINVLTAEQAALVRSDLRKAYFDAFNKGAIDADVLRRNLRAIDEQFKKLSGNASLLGSYLSEGIDGAINKLQEYSSNIDVIAAKMQRGDTLSKNEQGYVTNMLSMFGGKFGGEQLKGINSYETLINSFTKNGKGIKAAGQAFGQMGQGVSAAASKAGGAIAIVDAIVNAVNDAINAVQELIDELNKMRSEENKIAGWYRYLSDFNKYAFKGWNDLKSGNAVGVLVDIANSIISIFNNIQLSKVNKINDKIEDQSKFIEDLDYQYQRLETSIKKAFGSDYITNYNKQLETLYAQQEAYLKQAELERSKGKSSDEEKIKEYEKQARNTGDQIQDMQSQLSEFFTGTDLTSAAKDFANAWIEAYKEYGSVTTAMKEKFQDMIQSMVENSLAARVMQSFLQPIFDEIDRLSQEGTELSTTDIAAIAEMANAVIPNINDAMTTLMNTLTAGGYNIRQQAGQFTGIKRDIANASEESINGLTQATNVNNFYMQSIAQSVAQILAIMSGGTTEQTNAGTQALFNNELALQYMSALPNIDLNMAELLRCVKSVISEKNVATNANVIAVRA